TGSVVLEERRHVVGLAAFVAASAILARAAIAITAATAAAFPARAAVAVAPRGAVTARFARGTGVLQLLAGFLVDHAHRQADLAAVVDLEDLDLHFLAFGDDVGRLFDPLVLHLGDVDEAVLAAHEVHEGAEVVDVD